MAPQTLTRQGFVSSNQHTYSFIYIPATADKQTLLFLHGFPSQLHDWAYQIDFFTAHGYGVLVPDLLGYGSSSKPHEVHQYRLQQMSQELAELLDSLGLRAVVGVGHDFGSTLLSRFVAYHQDRLAALVFLSVGPPKLGTPFDVDAINKMTKEMLGFELLGYISWIARDSEAQLALETHAKSAMSLMFAAEPAIWNTWFHPLGKMKDFVMHDRETEVGDWYPPSMRTKHLEAFGCDGGYAGAIRWYRMWVDNLFAADEKGLETFKIQHPALLITSKSPRGSPNQQQQLLEEWTQRLQTTELESGHWVHMERADEVNKAIMGFILNHLS